MENNDFNQYVIAAGETKDMVKQTINANTPNPPTDSTYIEAVFNAGYALVGAVAVACIIYAGIAYATSNGEPEKAKKATRVLIYSVVGLLIVVLAAVITNLVFAGLKGG